MQEPTRHTLKKKKKKKNEMAQEEIVQQIPILYFTVYTHIRWAGTHNKSFLTNSKMPLSEMDFLQICWCTRRTSVFDLWSWGFRDIKMKYFFH